MLPHGLDADYVARGVQDREIFPRFGGDLIGCRLCAPDGDAWFQSADHVHGDRIPLRGVVTEAMAIQISGAASKSAEGGK